jgi:NAD(P)-dependent dehydrogenase (short-subunit alcohol dehydrogenase family)
MTASNGPATAPGELAGKVALVAGGAGNVGGGIVEAMLAAGAVVVVPSRSPERLAALRDRVGGMGSGTGTAAGGGRLDGVLGDVGTPEGAELVRDEVLTRHGAVDAVVAAVGGWWQGSALWETPVEEFDRVLASNLRPHFLLARALLPGMLDRRGTSYTMIAGDAAEQPVPRSGLASIAAAAHLMLMRTLAAEAKGHAVRVNLLLLGPVRTPARGGRGRPEWLTSADVGAMAAWLASDRASMVSGSVLRLLDRPEPEGTPDG